MLTDPTYLRYIVDGLESQSIQQENKAALPQGLMGMYEESLPAEQNIRQREKFLQFFSVWALLKKEVSASFVADLLNWKEQEVIDYISVYSKWFNSPASGTYILYHERLRSYLLSKITSNQLNQTNQKIIRLCQHALKLKKGDEWEIYALEHLPAHLFTPAMQDESQGVSFRNLVYDTSYWNRQLEISKGYDWSKKMLNLAMVWAAKQNTDELIECALNKIDLHYKEQNDAPRIVELVAQNDIETALQRIESFGGNDKEGLQRKFTLYMLCQMELTLLDSKNKPFRKTAIEKLINHLDENIPVDHSLLKWNDFFPSYLMFKMACEWAEMGLDYLRIYKRTDEWESDWIAEMGHYGDLQFEVLLECARGINDERYKSYALGAISTELAKQGKLEESLECARGINVERPKNYALRDISKELAKQGKFEIALECAGGIGDDVIGTIDALRTISTELAKQGKLEESLELARAINDEWEKSLALIDISTELAKQGKLEECESAMQEGLGFARGINDEFLMWMVLIDISKKLAKQKKFEKALECARNSDDEWSDEALGVISTELVKQGDNLEALEFARAINNETEKSLALIDISTELTKQGKLEEGASVMKEGLNFARGLDDGISNIETKREISAKLTKLGKFEEALEFVSSINDKRGKSLALIDISTELSKQGKLEEGASVIQEAFEFVSGINDEWKKIEALLAISTELSKHGKLEEGASVMQEALVCDSGINEEQRKIEVLLAIFTELSKQGKLEEGASVMQEVLEFARDISYEMKNRKAQRDISTELAKQGKLEESIECARGISYESERSEALRAISTELAKQGKLEEAIDFARRGIEDEVMRILLLIALSTELIKQGKLEEGASIMQEALEFVRSGNDEIKKSRTFRFISKELIKQGKLEEGVSVTQEALACARRINFIRIKSIELREISTELWNQGKIEEAIECVNSISSEYEKSTTLRKISMELIKLGKIEEAVEIGRGISDELENSKVMTEISTALVKHGKIEESLLALQEALECARGIKDDSKKNKALIVISTELSKEGNYDFSEQIGLEVNQVAQRYDSWKLIANQQKDHFGTVESLYNRHKFQSQEAQIFYLKGWVESITVEDISDELAHKAIQALQNDSTSLEQFLQVYAQHELFFGNPSQVKINRLNKTLKLQWALDIIAQFPQE